MFVPVCRIIGLLRNHSLGNSKRNEGHESTLRCLRGTQGHINTESLISNGSSPFKSNATFTHFKGTWYVEHGATLSILFPHTRKRFFIFFFYQDASLPSPMHPSRPSWSLWATRRSGCIVWFGEWDSKLFGGEIKTTMFYLGETCWLDLSVSISPLLSHTGNKRETLSAYAIWPPRRVSWWKIWAPSL